LSGQPRQCRRRCGYVSAVDASGTRESAVRPADRSAGLGPDLEVSPLAMSYRLVNPGLRGRSAQHATGALSGQVDQSPQEHIERARSSDATASSARRTSRHRPSLGDTTSTDGTISHTMITYRATIPAGNHPTGLDASSASAGTGRTYWRAERCRERGPLERPRSTPPSAEGMCDCPRPGGWLLRDTLTAANPGTSRHRRYRAHPVKTITPARMRATLTGSSQVS
jgi:hypothetical protein